MPLDCCRRACGSVFPAEPSGRRGCCRRSGREPGAVEVIFERVAGDRHRHGDADRARAGGEDARTVGRPRSRQRQVTESDAGLAGRSITCSAGMSRNGTWAPTRTHAATSRPHLPARPAAGEAGPHRHHRTRRLTHLGHRSHTADGTPLGGADHARLWSFIHGSVQAAADDLGCQLMGCGLIPGVAARAARSPVASLIT